MIYITTFHRWTPLNIFATCKSKNYSLLNEMKQALMAPLPLADLTTTGETDPLVFI